MSNFIKFLRVKNINLTILPDTHSQRKRSWSILGNKKLERQRERYCIVMQSCKQQENVRHKLYRDIYMQDSNSSPIWNWKMFSTEEKKMWDMNYIVICITPTLTLDCKQNKNERYELYSDTDTYMQDSNANPIWSWRDGWFQENN